MSDYSGSSVRCRFCQAMLAPTESVPHPQGACHVEFYACECGHKAVVMFEVRGMLSAEEQSWVDREVARRGSFFPTDFKQGAGRFGR